MYYIYNLENLGKTKIITYSNMFINNLMFGCKYKNQEYINNLAPIIEEVIPQNFLDLLHDELSKM
jgi:hypothetical protein